MGRRVCSPCLRGQHERCTSPASCECDHAEPIAANTVPPPGLVWEEPPRRGRPPLRLPDDVVAGLRANPGRWARVLTYASKTSAWTPAKTLRERLGDGFEIVGHRHGTGSAVFARWVGDA